MPLSFKTTKTDVDLLNNPKSLSMREHGSTDPYTILPYDIEISIQGEKVLAESKILDGVFVYERILRNPYEIDISFTIREIKTQPNDLDWTVQQMAAKDFVFPQRVMNRIFTQLWQKDNVLDVYNTMLNRLGIEQVVVKSVNISTVRGSTNVPCRLSCKENFVSTTALGSTLIVK